MTKVLLQNEIIGIEELEGIAGGNRDEPALDTQLSGTMGGRTKAYDPEDVTNTNVNGMAAKIDSLYGKLGIKVEYNDFGASAYSCKRQKITRNKAVEVALFNAGCHDIDPKMFQI